jgi:hypothetical protein
LSSPPRVIGEAATVARRAASSRPAHFRQSGALVVEEAEEGGDLVGGERRL